MISLEAQRAAAEAERKASEEIAKSARALKIQDRVLMGKAIIVGMSALKARLRYIAN